MTTPFPQQQTPSPQPGRDPRTVLDVEVPISGNPAHPVNSAGASVYFSRTDNFVGSGIPPLDDAQRAQILADAMRSTGPGKVLLLEASGPRDGNYVEELRRALPAALEMVPPEQRPELRLFISDGRPVAGGSPNSQDQPYNDFSTFLQSLDAQRANSGTVQIDNSQSVARAVPNWNNPEVVDFYLRERVQPAIDLAKELGIGTVVVDDHIGVPAGANMNAFKRVNGFNDQQATNAITGAYERVLGTIEAAGLNTGLSTAAEPGVYGRDGPTASLRMGIDIARLAPHADIVEIQGYRNSGAAVQAMTDRLYDDVSRNFDRYRGVDEFKVALVTKANGEPLSQQTLIDQQRAIDRLEDRLGDLYRSRGAEPPAVTTSLWAHQNFHEDATLRLGDGVRDNVGRKERVQELQEALNAAGIRVDGRPLVPDGDFGGNTLSAVTQYQQQQGLPATGVADKDTQVALGIYPGLRLQTPEQLQAPPVTPPTDQTSAPTPVVPTTPDQPVASLPPQPTAPTLQVPPGLYREGSEGEGVRTLQQALNLNGAQLAADGDFGPLTRRAVEQYQRANGLQVDGIAGPQTIGHLNESLQRQQQGQTQTASVDGAAPSMTNVVADMGGAQNQLAAITRDPLYAQAQEALKTLPEGTFAERRERDNMAGALVLATRELYGTAMTSIAEVRMNARGDGVLALATGGDDEFQMRSHVGLTQGKSTPLQDSGEALLQKGLAVAQQQGTQAPGMQQQDAAPQRVEQPASAVLVAQNSPSPDTPEQGTPSRGLRV